MRKAVYERAAHSGYYLKGKYSMRNFYGYKNEYNLTRDIKNSDKERKIQRASNMPNNESSCLTSLEQSMNASHRSFKIK